MRSLTIIFSLFILNAGHTQEWTNVNPNPSPLEYFSIHIDESGKGVFVGFKGIVSLTNDFGNNFRNIYTGTIQTLNAVDSPDGKTYITVGNGGTILKSDDEGENWESINIDENENLLDVKFFNETIVVVVGRDGTVLRSEDSGLTWNEIEINTNFAISKLFLINEEEGFLWSRNSNFLYKTTDSGLTWSKIETDLDFIIGSIYFSDSNSGLIFVGENLAKGYIYKTNDGGNSWTEVQQESDRFFANTYFIDENNGFASNYLGYVFRTEDGGITWDPIPDNELRIEKIFGDGNNVIFGLRHSIISRTTDFGSSSERLNSNVAPFYLTKVIFNNDDIYIAGSSMEGIVLKSKDGGVTFSSLDVEWPFGINDFIYLGDDKFIAVGESKNIMKSDDGGETWYEQFLTNSSSVSITSFNNSVWILTYDGKILKSDDLGDTWNLIFEESNENKEFYEITFVNELKGFVTSTYPTELSFTLDGGISWQRHPNTIFSCRTCLQYVDDNIGYYIGDQVYKTVDGGSTFEIVNSNIPGWAHTIFFRSELVGYITDESKNFWKTEDGGKTWEKQVSFFIKDINSIDFNDEGIGIAVGVDGLILRIEEGSLSSNQVQQVMKLPDMGIFPNPTSQEINLLSENFSDKSVLQFFNINGNLISEIKGNHSSSPIDVRSLPAGTYFILHSNGELREKGIFVKQ